MNTKQFKPVAFCLYLAVLGTCKGMPDDHAKTRNMINDAKKKCDIPGGLRVSAKLGNIGPVQMRAAFVYSE